MRDMLIAAYLDYVNNYVSSALYGEHNGLTNEEAETLVKLARKVYEHKHSDA